VPKTVADGFDEFLSRLTPTETQREAAARHRGRVESSLNSLGVHLYRETGSFHHGTGVRNYCDVDLLASLKSQKPGSSETALRWVKDALLTTFPNTAVKVHRPAVVVYFNQGAETWEIIPGFRKSVSGSDAVIYSIPGVTTEWLESAPIEHIGYVNEINNAAGKKGGTKKLARLVKAWKHYNSVPVSSFYLEMRAAKYMETEKSFVPLYDMCRLLALLESNSLAAMNDPRGMTGRFTAYSTTAKRTEALSKLKTATTRAQKAVDAHEADQPATAFHYLDLLFGGHFPSR
jgi:hypothetical protein